MLDVAIMFALVLVIIGSYTDFRWREVPDWLNFSVAVIGGGLAIAKSILLISWTPVLAAFFGGLLFFGIGYLLFLLGQWGGGDAKSFIALGILLGFQPLFDHAGVAFLVNMVWVGALYGIIYTLILFFSKVLECIKEIKELMHQMSYRWLLIVSFAAFAFMLVFTLAQPSRPVLILLTVAVPVLACMAVLVRAVERACMLKWVQVSDLTEGDWLVKPVRVDGKIVVQKGGVGLVQKDLALLAKLARQKKVNKVLVKVGMPFVPCMLLALLATIVWGNLAVRIF